MRNKNHNLPLLQRVDALFRTIINKDDLYISIRDAVLYEILQKEAGCIAVQHEDADLLVMMDVVTASAIENCEAITEKAAAVVLLNGAEAFSEEATTSQVSSFCKGLLNKNDRLVVLLSRTISLALFCQEFGDDAGENFLGGWTVQRSVVVRLARMLLEGQQEVPLPEMPDDNDVEDTISSAMMRLTALHAEALESREKTVSVEKNDLLSVLDILKAISAKRHARDILFVFVEQIARIIPTDRCSIVCIGEGNAEGTVLVSHENENFKDCAILLEKYPELIECVHSGEMLAINSVSEHPVTRKVSDDLQRAGIMALVVLPITCDDRQKETLILRAARRHASFTLREISFFQIVTEAAANALDRAHLFESVEVANERLEQLAITDSLTGIYNRRYFNERFEQEFERALRYRLPFSCVLFDIDDFKKVNDIYGHLVGDFVLKEVAQCMVNCTRRVDILARYGGEEFVILLPQTNLHGASVEAERVRATIEKHIFEEMSGERKITISVGVAALNCDTMTVCNDLLRAADMALYAAKSDGKNRVVLHENDKKE